MLRAIWTVASADLSPSTPGSETLYDPEGTDRPYLRQANTR